MDNLKQGQKSIMNANGEGVIHRKCNYSGFTPSFLNVQEKMDFSRLSDEFEIIEQGDGEAPSANGKSVDEIVGLLKNVLEEFNGISEIVELGEKWEGGTMVLNPGNPDLQSKEIPIEQFFHKIVMVRDRLRVLEQNINSHDKLTDEDKV